MKFTYFDYASTTPVDKDVVKAMKPYFHDVFGNPSSPHSIGRKAQVDFENARERVAKFLGASAQEVIFNSGATEGNNHALIGAAYALRAQGQHIIVSAIEHHSILEPAEFLAKNGFKVTYLPVDGQGCVDIDVLKDSLTKETILVAVMHASNEIGSIQPVEEIGALLKEKKVHFHVDAVQTIGHIPVDVNAIGADTLSLSAHKLYGPKGVGALYIRSGVKLEKLLRGGDQERDQRASTQNVAGAVGLAKAIELCASAMENEAQVQSDLRNHLIKEVTERIDGVKVNGHLLKRLPNNVHFSFKGVEGESLLMSLDMESICASMGSACTSGAMAASHVLKAIGLDDDLAYGALRITIGRWTTEEEVEKLIEVLPGIVKGLRN